MINNLHLSGANYKIESGFKHYVSKRLGKLDRYLPRGHKKDAVLKVVVTEVDRAHGNKYELSAALEIPGGEVLAAKDEASNVFAGVDILEAKLMGQIRRFKTEKINREQKGVLRRLFRR